MASIVDLCWTNSQDLFADVDLYSLYVRQLRALGAEADGDYPYHILIYTGKITIGINLGPRSDVTRGQILFQDIGKGRHNNAL